MLIPVDADQPDDRPAVKHFHTGLSTRQLLSGKGAVQRQYPLAQPCLFGGCHGSRPNCLTAARIVHSLGSSATEALPVQCVYFLHERGEGISYHTVALSSGAIAPLPAVYMLAARYGFRLFFWIEFGCAIVLSVASFFLVPETAYKRNAIVSQTDLGTGGTGKVSSVATQTLEADGAAAGGNIEVTSERTLAPRRTDLASLKPWSGIDHDVEFWTMILRSSSYWLVSQVLSLTCSYGQTRTRPIAIRFWLC